MSKRFSLLGLLYLSSLQSTSFVEFWMSQNIEGSGVYSDNLSSCTASNTSDYCTFQTGMYATSDGSNDTTAFNGMVIQTNVTAGPVSGSFAFDDFGNQAYSGGAFLVGASNTSDYIITYPGSTSGYEFPCTESIPIYFNYYEYYSTDAFNVAFQDAKLTFSANDVYVNGLSSNWSGNVWACSNGVNLLFTNNGVDDGYPGFVNTFADTFQLSGSNTNPSAGTVFAVTEGVTVTINGVISGEGALIVGSNSEYAETLVLTGTLVLTATNTYEGGTTITLGTLQVSEDANFGETGTSSTPGPAVNINGGTLSVTQGFTSYRGFSMNGTSSTSQSNPANAVVSVPAQQVLTFTGEISVGNNPGGQLTVTGGGGLSLTTSAKLSDYIPFVVVTDSSTCTGNTYSLYGSYIDVDAGSAIVFDSTNSGDGTFGGNIYGAGTMEIQGPNTVTFTPSIPLSSQTTFSLNITDTPFAGTVLLTSGILNLGSSSSSGATAVTSLGTASVVGNGGTLEIANFPNRGSTVTQVNAACSFDIAINNNGLTLYVPAGSQYNVQANFSGIISDEVSSTGTLTITGGNTEKSGTVYVGSISLTNTDNTYSGGTILTSGTLSISEDISSDSVITGTLGSSSGGITGSGGTLQATDSFTLSRSIVLTSGTNTTFNVSKGATLTLTGTISGEGTVTIAGGGTVTMTGYCPYTGKTTVDTGATFNPSTDTSSSVDPLGLKGSLIEGVGIVGETHIHGALTGGDPQGNVVGTLTVKGPLFFYDDSIFFSVTRGGLVSLVTVEGSIALPDRALSLVLNQAGDYREERTYTVLAATDGVTGEFAASHTMPSFFLHSRLTYDDNHVYLTLKPDQISEASIHGENAEHVAQALNQTIEWNRSHVNYYPTAHGPVADPKPRSEEVLASLLFLSDSERNTALNELYSTLYTGVVVTAESAMIQVAGVEEQRMEEVMNARSCHKQELSSSIWLTGLGDFLNQESVTNSYGFNPSYHSATGGAVLGIDHRIGVFHTGILGAYTHSHITWKSDLGNGNLSTGYAGVYLSALGKFVYANASVIGGWGSFSGNREINYVSLAPKADFVSSELLSHLDVGVNYRFGGNKRFLLKPFDRFDYITQKEHEYKESKAGEFGLQVSKNRSIYIRNELGLQFSACMQGWGATWTLSPKASWIREVRLAGGTYTEELLGSEEPFSAVGYFPDRSLVSPGMIFSAETGKWIFQLSYTGEFGSGYNNNQAAGEARFTF
ncbi:MAG: autotransporter domain-containing protein [Chlamydiae bacterium]|nr:autotransporter domain-containing protein [Chlamydiota bacterium]